MQVFACILFQSLLPSNDGDNNPGKPLDDRTGTTAPLGDGNSLDTHPSNSQGLEGVQYVQQVLLDIKGSQEAFHEANREARSHYQRIKSEALEECYVARMQQFLDSGDPILMAEALAWAQVNPGVLEGDNAQNPKTF